MENQYLFAAEVNQIQPTLFANSLQRQVVGGSRLLAKFTEYGANEIASAHGAAEVVVKAGGNFRIIFNRLEDAASFGRDIQDVYRLLLNGTMTIAPPEPFNDGTSICLPDQENCRPEAEDKCFHCANKKLDHILLSLKQGEKKAVVHPQAPTIAFCDSSGTALAVDYTSPVPEQPDEKRYMSSVALAMKEVGGVSKPGTVRKREPEDVDFLGPIKKAIPDKSYHDLIWIGTPEDAAYWDSARSNVAYLVADGNNMGQFFSRCRTAEQRCELSEALQDVVREAIAAPIPKLVAQLFNSSRSQKRERELPLLPLIVAGDDIFILLPAPYALDYARHFCQVFEEKMNAHEAVKALQNDLKEGDKELPRITMGAAVVFCKQSYPYDLAHGYGEKLLSQTKPVVKRVGQEKEVGEWLSAVSFGMIVGSESVNGRSFPGIYKPVQTTYWASEPKTPLAKATTLPLSTLTDYRMKLLKVPGKRRAELRDLFNDAPISKDKDLVEAWQKRLAKLNRRLEKTNKDAFNVLHQALADLGDLEADKKTNPAQWRQSEHDDDYYHALPDLLATWPYAQSLDEELDQYDKEADS